MKNVCILPVCMHIYCATWSKHLLGSMIPPQMTSLTELFYSLTLLNTHVSLSFSLDVQLNMLQESSNTGQNSQTSNKESKTN